MVNGARVIVGFILLSCLNPWTLTPAFAQGTSSNALAVPLFGQDTPNWCWMASAEMVANYLGIAYVEQCQEANNVFGRSDCCPASNSPCAFDGTPDTISNYDNIQFTSTNAQSPTTISFSDLKNQIDHNSPIISFWNPPGHFRVVAGYATDPTTNWIFLLDPEPVGQGDYLVWTYEEFACTAAGSTCTHQDDTYGVVPSLSAEIINQNSQKCLDVPGEHCRPGHRAAVHM